MTPQLCSSSHRRSAGFTLVELLVVIGIISALVAILMPALNKARESAISLKCLSNLRQIGIASQQYLADNAGQLFPCFWAGDAGPPALQPTGLDVILESYVPRTNLETTLWRCPAALPVPNQFPQTYACNQGVHANISYGPGQQLRVWRDVSGNWHNTLKKSTQVKRHTEVVSLGDASQSSGAFTSAGWLDWTSSDISEMNNLAVGNDPIDKLAGWSWTNTDTGNYHLRYRHDKNRMANVLFMDGHAEQAEYNSPAHPNVGLRNRNFATGY
jgi:prepilin-type N-terminal cleavage/methylation domain-containing protein/prepilin-type processing-associated H-X9-DG protein